MPSFRLLLIWLLPLAAAAQQAVPPVASASAEVVNVQGLRNPELKSYRTMLRGKAAFERHHALAPQATLAFVLLPKAHDVDLSGLELRIAGDSVSVPVALDAAHRFRLPEVPALAADADADLVLNRKRHSITWRPDIHTPGVPDGYRRLGDLRLECAVRWAVEVDDLPFLQSQAFKLLGGPCGSKLVNTIFLSPRRLQAVVLLAASGARPLDLEQHGWGFVPPLADPELSDDTLIELRYAD